jgi:hypothetical protein
MVEKTTKSLCESCQHVREVMTPKKSRFLLCQLSSSSPKYPKYPRQPVLKCEGYQPNDRPPHGKNTSGS